MAKNNDKMTRDQEFVKWVLPRVRELMHEVRYEDFMGLVYVDLSENHTLYCTPFWDCVDGVALELQCDGDILAHDLVEYETTGDVNHDAQAYVTIVQTYIDGLVTEFPNIFAERKNDAGFAGGSK